MHDPKPAVEERLAVLEGNDRMLIKLSVEQNSLNLALASMVIEMLVHAGIPRQKAIQQVRDRQAHFQDDFYRRLENRAPGLAADLDTRPAFDFQLPAEMRPLFPAT